MGEINVVPLHRCHARSACDLYGDGAVADPGRQSGVAAKPVL